MKGEYNKIEVVEGQHCPLCGSKAELWEYVTDYNTTKSVMCSGGEECILSLTPDSFHKPTKREAVDHWTNFVQSTQTFKLESKLAASEEARKKLIESHDRDISVLESHVKLAEKNANYWRIRQNEIWEKFVKSEQRAEAAEKLIEDSRNQEPQHEIRERGEGGLSGGWKKCSPQEYRQAFTDLNMDMRVVYLQPPIPPELSEVMREMDELKRKLAEHQAVFFRMGYVNVDGNKELNRLLSEARKVPEGLRKISSERLPPEFEKVLTDNLWELYEAEDSPTYKEQP